MILYPNKLQYIGKKLKVTASKNIKDVFTVILFSSGKFNLMGHNIPKDITIFKTWFQKVLENKKYNWVNERFIRNTEWNDDWLEDIESAMKRGKTVFPRNNNEKCYCYECCHYDNTFIKQNKIVYYKCCKGVKTNFFHPCKDQVYICDNCDSFATISDIYKWYKPSSLNISILRELDNIKMYKDNERCSCLTCRELERSPNSVHTIFPSNQYKSNNINKTIICACNVCYNYDYDNFKNTLCHFKDDIFCKKHNIKYDIFKFEYNVLINSKNLNKKRRLI
jgi:hypothetical protein